MTHVNKKYYFLESDKFSGLFSFDFVCELSTVQILLVDSIATMEVERGGRGAQRSVFDKRVRFIHGGAR